MRKKGSHVGMMLSFVVFIGFLLFIYSILGPQLRVERDKQTMLDYLKLELIKNQFNADLIISSIKIKEETEIEGSCFSIPHFAGEFDYSEVGAVVKNDKNELIDCESTTSNLKIADREDKFFKIFISEVFPPKNIEDSCPELSENKYLVGGIKTEEFVFEGKVFELLEKMSNKTNYEQIKSELNIPAGTEFGFSFQNQDGDVNSTNEKNISTNIFVEEIPVQYFDTEANINSGFISIRVW